jgi:hypothetical protein
MIAPVLEEIAREQGGTAGSQVNTMNTSIERSVFGVGIPTLLFLPTAGSGSSGGVWTNPGIEARVEAFLEKAAQSQLGLLAGLRGHKGGSSKISF